MTKQLDILAFAPHPDDAELGCAGSLILAADDGLRTAVADLTEGESSSRGTPVQKCREKEEASQMMGLCHRFSLGLPDTAIGANRAHLISLVELIRKTRPRIVLAPCLHDRHPDHAAASKLVQNACFYAGVRKVGAGAPFRPQGLFFYLLHYLSRPFTPSFVMDISPVWERKLAAIQVYASQFQTCEKGVTTALSTPEFMRFVDVKAAWFGAMIGARYGEPYAAPGPLPLREFPTLASPVPADGAALRFSMF